MKKYLVLTVSLVFVAFVGQTARGEELRVKICNDKRVCTPIIGSTASSVDMEKVQALTARATRLKKAIDAVDGRDRSKVDQFADEVIKLKDENRKLRQDVDGMNGKLVPTTYTAADAERLAKETRGSLGRLAKDVSALQAKVKAATALARVKRPTINLELGAVGFGAYPLGVGGGLQASLVFPMGKGLWNTRISGGLGVTSSPGLGWLASVSLTRKLGKEHIVSIGPAILAMGDEGNLMGDTKWAFGGGLEFRLKLGSRGHLVATPFVGVASETKVKYIGSGWADAVSKTDCYTDVCGTWCHTEIIREAGERDYYDSGKKLSFAVGGTLAFVISLF